MQPTAIKAIPSDTLNASDFIHEVKYKTLEFYKKLPQDVEYKGIVSECETFIHNINKYKYLFGLTDIRLY